MRFVGLKTIANLVIFLSNSALLRNSFIDKVRRAL